MQLSIFWRLVLGSVAIIVVVAGVNLYALTQLRQLTALSTELVSSHYPAIETTRRLTDSVDGQLRSERKYWIVRDAALLKEFDQEAEEFRRMLTTLQTQEESEGGRRLLQRAVQEHDQYLALVRGQGEPGAGRAKPGGDYEHRRDALIEKLTDILDAYVSLREVKVGAVVSESRMQTKQTEAVLQQLLPLSILIALALAAVASYSVLLPLRRIQQHMRVIGQGQFGAALDATVPQELRALVDTVNWMGAKLKELDDMKAEFFSHTSHELRTPLASIREGTQLLLDQIPGPLTAQQRETLRIMHESSRRLIHQISALLDISKMDAGMMDYHFTHTDLKRLADSSVDKVCLLAESKRIPIFIHAPDSRLSVPIDAARIEQVFDNLLSNALKFSPDGVPIHITIEPDPAAGGVRISVADAGAGIAPEDLPHVFKRFYQGRRQAKHTMAGSGVGLALAKKIIEAHQGRIWVESEVRKGTTVRFVLPIKEQGVKT